jgi:hypothetical protein
LWPEPGNRDGTAKDAKSAKSHEGHPQIPQMTQILVSVLEFGVWSLGFPKMLGGELLSRFLGGLDSREA